MKATKLKPAHKPRPAKATSPASSKKAVAGKPPKPPSEPPDTLEPLPWWGEGLPPWERWAGVSIKIEAIWRPLRGAKQITEGRGTKYERTFWVNALGVEIPNWYGNAGGRWESPDGKYFFDIESASDARDFFSECLTHTKAPWAGRPFDLEEWQALLVVVPVFGWKITATGFRRFRKVYVEIPKKNGKSKLAGGIGLYMTFCDGEAGAEIICAAADREQAAIVFDDAKAMVEDCPDLFDRSLVYRRSIVYPETRSTFKVVSADVKSKHGPNIHCLIFDELHVQNDRELFETLEKGIAARDQPLILMLTTAGDDQESICYEQHEYAESVIKYGGDDSFLPVLFNLNLDAKAGPVDDWSSLQAAMKVNPNYGITVKAEYFENEIRAALKEPRKANNYKRLHLNIWTQQNRLWIPIERWDACKKDFTLEELQGIPVAGGMDLSSKIDLTAFVLAFKHYDNPDEKPVEIELDPTADTTEEIKKFLESLEPAADTKKKKFKINFRVTLVPFFWMPEESLTERKKTDRFGYDVLKEEGLIEVTEGNIIDYDAIYAKILELSGMFHLKDAEIGYDPWNATQLVTQLQKEGFKLVEVPQNYRHLSEPSKVYEALVQSGRIRHSGHRVLRWNVENVSVKEDPAGNIRPIKSSKMKRIDGVIASVDAISRLLVHKETSGPVAMWV